MKSIKFIFIIILVPFIVFSQKRTLPPEWHHLDLKKDKVLGISTDRAYSELLQNKKPVPVIVAVIDGGVDVKHEDLAGHIWVNEKEILGNGIDDDANGYIDDIYGWNFIGNAKGENIDFETLEMTRVIAKNYKNYKLFEKGEYKPVNEKERDYMKRVLRRFYSQYNDAKNRASKMVKYYANYIAADSIVKIALKKESYTKEDIDSLKTGSNEQLKVCQEFLLDMYSRNVSVVDLSNALESERKKLDYRLNVKYNPREEILGDDPTKNENPYYGNPDVIGPDAGHGTACAGIIAADRSNNKGMKGIAPEVKIMSIRIVPNGDERDKDVANAIKYAVDNGAKVINMSFGKEFSPEKYLVDEVLEYISKKDVLLIHSAGNDGCNNDDTLHFPLNIRDNGDTIFHNWITVGANDKYLDKKFAARFSNYGIKTVDIFAPGVNVYCTEPDNKYGPASGTSFSTPVVSGIAALLLSYFPEMSCKEVKDIILQSGLNVGKKKTQIPSKGNVKDRKIVKFKTLSRTGAIANVYNAVKLAEKKTTKKSLKK